MTDAPSLKLRILKSWVSQDHTLIFQCQSSLPHVPKKIHLILDLKQQSFGASLRAEKPGEASANHAFIQILRKHLPQFTIREIRCEPMTGDIYIPLLAGTDTNTCWHLRLSKSKPPLASLISPDQQILVSHGQKGTFTKRHQLEAPLPQGPFRNLLPELFAHWESPEEDAQDAEEGENEAQAEGTAAPTISKAQRELRSRLKRKLRTVTKTLEKLRRELPSAEEVKRLEQQATLLQTYSYLVKGESIALTLDPALTGLEEVVTIDLDSEKSRGQQIEFAFHQARRTRRSRELGQKQLDQAEAQALTLIRDMDALAREEMSEAEREALIRRYQLPDLGRTSSKGETPSAKPFKTYAANTGHTLLVGKGAHENDALTKAARSNDYWLHAVGVTGSHVIIPVTADIRQTLPPALQKEAAILALHFSKFKEDLAGECYVTRKAQLKKPKGMPPGLWQINKSESIFVRYTAEELQRLLQTVRI